MLRAAEHLGTMPEGCIGSMICGSIQNHSLAIMSMLCKYLANMQTVLRRMQMHRSTGCHRDSLNALAYDEAAGVTGADCRWEYGQSTCHDSPYTKVGPVTGPVDTLHSTRARICNADIGPCRCTVHPCKLVRLYSPPASSSALTTTVCCCRSAKPLHKA